MAGKQAVDETNVIGNEQAEDETENARTGDEPAIEPGKTRAGIRKRKRQSQGNQHHSRDRSDPENQKIKDAPARAMNRAQNEQGYSSGARQTVHDADQ